MKRVFTWLNNSLEEFLMGAGLIMMTAIMGIQVVFLPLYSLIYYKYLPFSIIFSKQKRL